LKRLSTFLDGFARYVEESLCKVLFFSAENKFLWNKSRFKLKLCHSKFLSLFDPFTKYQIP